MLWTVRQRVVDLVAAVVSVLPVLPAAFGYAQVSVEALLQLPLPPVTDLARLSDFDGGAQAQAAKVQESVASALTGDAAAGVVVASVRASAGGADHGAARALLGGGPARQGRPASGRARGGAPTGP